MSSDNDNNRWFVQNLRGDVNKELLLNFRGERSGYLQVGPGKYLLPKKFGRDADNYANFKSRPSDTWVVSFPRSGTTWTQEMVWLLANDLDFENAKKIPLIERFPFLEFSSCVHEKVFDEFLTAAGSTDVKNKLTEACRPYFEDLEKMTESRFIKSHLPFSLLPSDLLTCGAKVVYVARNPKDVAVSYYHFHKFIKTLDFVGDFKTFWKYFEENLVMWAPYWNHVEEAWQLRKNPNLLFLFYEDLKKDLKKNIEVVAAFLNKQYNEGQIAELVSHLDFSNFQKNGSVNMEVLRNLGMLSDNNERCIREGRTGNWRQLFTDDLLDRADKWMEKHLLNTDFKFP